MTEPTTDQPSNDVPDPAADKSVETQVADNPEVTGDSVGEAASAPDPTPAQPVVSGTTTTTTTAPDPSVPISLPTAPGTSESEPSSGAYTDENKGDSVGGGTHEELVETVTETVTEEVVDVPDSTEGQQ